MFVRMQVLTTYWRLEFILFLVDPQHSPSDSTLMWLTPRPRSAELPGKVYTNDLINKFPTFRISVLDVSLITGYAIGNFFSAIIFEKCGFYGTFGITLGILCFNFLFIYFFIEESR